MPFDIKHTVKHNEKLQQDIAGCDFWFIAYSLMVNAVITTAAFAACSWPLQHRLFVAFIASHCESLCMQYIPQRDDVKSGDNPFFDYAINLSIAIPCFIPLIYSFTGTALYTSLISIALALVGAAAVYVANYADQNSMLFEHFSSKDWFNAINDHVNAVLTPIASLPLVKAATDFYNQHFNITHLLYTFSKELSASEPSSMFIRAAAMFLHLSQKRNTHNHYHNPNVNGHNAVVNEHNNQANTPRVVR